METCVIFCAAGFDGLAEPVRANDLVIAADGGYRHTCRLHLTPDVILGDFDSLGYIPDHANLFPVEKDDTDAMLAIRHGLSRGCRRFVIYGGLDGSRLDHTLANFQALQFLAEQGAEGTLVGRDYIIRAVRNGTLRFDASAQGIISVFCMGSDARGVCIRGLQYELDNGTLRSGFPLGVSNHFVGRESSISVSDGTLLVFWDRKNGLPEV